MICKCQYCNKEFKGFPSRVKEGKEKYCSQKCSWKAKIGIPINKGIPKTLKHRKNLSKARKGKYFGNKSPAWKNGKYISQDGYLLISIYPRGYILEHRLVMEKYLKRKLKPNEVIHHINGNRLDNHIENLMIFKSPGKHHAYHRMQKDYLLSNCSNS